MSEHKHEIGLNLGVEGSRKVRIVCVSCGQEFDHDFAAGYLERHHDLERWRRLKRQLEIWTVRLRQGVRIEPPVQTLEALESDGRV